MISQPTEDSTDDEIIDFILNELAPPISNDTPFNGLVDVITSDRVYSIIDDLREKEVASNIGRGFGSHGSIMTLLPKGKEINKKGGWIRYHQDAQAEKINNQQKQYYKEQLELLKTQLEVEKFEYDKSNREKDEKIKALTSLNLTLQNAEIIYRWASGLLGLLVGLILEHYSELIRWLIKHLM